MPGLINSTEIELFTGIFMQHFETFSANRNLVVYKEPIKVVNDFNANQLPGYGSDGNESNYTFIPVSGTFPAMVVYDQGPDAQIINDLQTTVPLRQIKIKVKPDARNFINNGSKNKYFEIDGLTFNNVTSESVQNYLGLIFYIFNLKQTN